MVKSQIIAFESKGQMLKQIDLTAKNHYTGPLTTQVDRL